MEFFNITEIITTYGYAGVFVIVFLESGVFFALPGDSLLFTAGLLAGAGVLSICKLILLIFIATVVGGFVGYSIGQHLERLRKFRIFNKILKKKYINKAHKFFEKHGKFTILLSRFVPFVRTFAPIVAGVAKMNYRHFVISTFVGALLWAFFMPLLGYFLGQIIPGIGEHLSLVVVGILLISLIPVLWGVIKERG